MFMQDTKLTQFYDPTYLYDLSQTYQIDPRLYPSGIHMGNRLGKRKPTMDQWLQSSGHYLFRRILLI